MDDIMQKIQEVLSDPESMKQVEELAKMFGTPNTQNEQPPQSGFDMGSLAAIGGLMNSGQNDINTELLLALRPHLREEKQQKVDKAVKLMKLLALYSVLKESGALKDLL